MDFLREKPGIFKKKKWNFCLIQLLLPSIEGKKEIVSTVYL